MTTLAIQAPGYVRKPSPKLIWLLLGLFCAGLTLGMVPGGDPGPSSESQAVVLTVETPPETKKLVMAPTFSPELAERQALAKEIARYRPDKPKTFHMEIASLILEVSEESGFDPFFIASLVGVESSFDPTATSVVGAMGLMQIRPFVAKALAEEDPEIVWTGPAMLFDPEVNLRLGVQYYRELLTLFKGDHAKALSAYNYGPTRIRQWVRDGSYQSTRYAAKILKAYERQGGDSTSL